MGILDSQYKKRGVAMLRKQLLLSENLAARITDFRFENRINSEQETMRLLMEYGLEWKGKRDADSTGNDGQLRED
jgi:hypothetical protein